MFELVENDIIEEGLRLMDQAYPSEKVKGVLGARRADGSEAYCSIGWVCLAASKRDDVELKWIRLQEARGLITGELEAQCTQQGITHLAMFDDCIFGMPAELTSRIGGDEHSFYVGNGTHATSFLRLNDDTDLAPAEIAREARRLGCYIET